MNSLIITRAKTYTKFVAIFVVASTITVSVKADWSVDFSRRAKAIREADLNDAAHADGIPSIDTDSMREPASVPAAPAAMNPTVPSEDVGKPTESPTKSILAQVFDSGEPVQEIVILNTEKGFVPNTVRVRKNSRYKISVVNVNEKEKNVSFILDGFAEHHATYYGKVKTFTLNANKEGVFSFESPETAAEGKLVVYNPPITVRNPASEK